MLPMSKLKIYTRTGDRGQTSLYGGKRVSKNHIRVNAYGTIDELNSLLGIVLSLPLEEKIEGFLRLIQSDLFTIGGYLAGANVSLQEIKRRVSEMETLIDWMDKDLPPLKNFILPTGTQTGSFLFFARAVARRCERELIALSEKEKIADEIFMYMNRLSDLLFMMARYTNHKHGVAETLWKSKIK